MSGGYAYMVNNKKGEVVDLWLMDAPDPKNAIFVFSCRFARYVKPKRSKPIMKLIDEALSKGGDKE